jgi:hypothetical protein
MTREQQARRIRAAIIDLSKKDDSLSVNEIRVILALERVVARLAHDPLLDKHLVYKGGFVLLKTLGSTRFTRDLDAIGLDLDQGKIEKLVPKALAQDLGDGFWFGEIQLKPLEDQGDYGALRFSAAYQIGDPPEGEEARKKLSRIHFDVGFGDEVPKTLSRKKIPGLLDQKPSVSWRVYPPEYIFSEKLQTLIARASVNSRAKDIHDLVIIYPECSATKLIVAIAGTFAKRRTELPHSFKEFAESLDTRLIESSWTSVQLADRDSEFRSTWRDLLKMLEKLDSLTKW